MTIQFPIVIAFNIPKFKPACVNLQGIYGGNARLAMLFEPDCWDMTPNDDIKAYPLANQKQLDALIKRSEAIHVKKNKAN
tara:strand:+ start:1547 stop:1786 length:240 start_codon:yes stop_codon:yes gene_type:complete